MRSRLSIVNFTALFSALTSLVGRQRTRKNLFNYLHKVLILVTQPKLK